ncbi:hypothetical protein [Streptomyces lavendofoliae]|uniref:Uncharacterized protein n=1 Tax=Streptomyces lavendofoliae TaxID=67314 RepID=A0A918HUW8_9ACTN|nr:hypothetical protein [Streptomyces lavendofoliae]GGU26826.1 hypothetical protein GCM10010274_11660 [Streptomyces lavendofoliae]
MHSRVARVTGVLAMVFAIALGGAATAAHAGPAPGGTITVVAGDEGPSTPKPGAPVVITGFAPGA